MILVDKPYLSDFLKQTITVNNYPVVVSNGAQALGLQHESYLLNEKEAVINLRKAMQATGAIKVYTTSENAIGWIGKHLSFTGLPEKIELFKNKARFREMIQPLHPRFYFKEVQLDSLRDLDLSAVPFPIIVKPSVGFFSMGVHRVESAAQWPEIVSLILVELEEVAGLYPVEVMDGASFILEQCIEGDEFAVDAYFDADGHPVVLNILEHVFSSADDVSDRVYVTGASIIRPNLEPFTDYLREISKLSGVRDFPVHMEVRRTPEGEIVPIEINAMRFGGWCSTADLAGMAYGFNPYEYYFQSRKPNWQDILNERKGLLYAVVVLDNSTGINGKDIAYFNYNKLESEFETVLDVRPIDFKEYPVFGFVFTQTREDNYAELERILTSDLTEYVTRKV